MAMSLIPEEFPVVFSVFLILGVLRLAKTKALTRHMVMVETLGSATVICTDKTGTLTEGRMSLERIYLNGKIYDKKDFKKAGEAIGKGLASLINIFAPDAIIIGGGFGHNESKKYLPYAKSEIKKYILFPTATSASRIMQIALNGKNY